MAKYDHGGGCACGLYKVCCCESGYRWAPPVRESLSDQYKRDVNMRQLEQQERRMGTVATEPVHKWIGVDLDGTLFVYFTWGPPCDIGEPIPPMVQLVKHMLARGKDVRIFTARAFELDGTPVPAIIAAIEAKCLEHLGKVLPITNRKDYACQCIFDDRAVTVQSNTGRWYAWDGLVKELEKSNVFDS